MNKLFLLRALNLLGNYIELTNKCRCTPLAERKVLFDRCLELLTDVDNEGDSEDAPNRSS